MVFVDVVGSTALGESTDAETVREMLLGYFAVARQALVAHGGTVEKFIGDAVMAVFGVPVLHEDDALRAVRAAVEIRDAVRGLDGELRERYGRGLLVRIGVATGEVTTGDRSTPTLVTGDVANLAARLEQAAGPAQVLIAPATYTLVQRAVDARQADALSLKGKAERVVPWAVGSVLPVETGRPRRFAPAFVGRATERAVLDEALKQARAGRPQLVTLIGEPGAGKSALVRDAAGRWADEVACWSMRCQAYGESSGFEPVARLVRTLAAADGAEPTAALRGLLPAGPDREAVVAGVVALAGLAPPNPTAPNGAWAVEWLLRSVARQLPLVIAVDDVQWASDPMLDLIAGAVTSEERLPLLVLATARPEFVTRQPGWAAPGDGRAPLRLGPLPEPDANELLSHLLGGPALPDRARGRLLAAAHGNPLFLEETLGMLADDGLLAGGSGSWELTGELTDVPLPQSVAALVAARLDLLAPADREVLQHASVLGVRCERAALVALLPPARRQEVEACLARLDEADLLHAELVGPGEAAEPVLSFHHQVVRDVVYAAVTKRRRIEMHAAAADVLARNGAGVERGSAASGLMPGVVEAQQAQAAHHLEQSVLLATELGPLRATDRARAGDAVHLLVGLSRQVGARGETAATADLLRRASRLLPTGDAQLPRVLAELGSSLVDAGQYDAAAGVLTEAQGSAQDRQDHTAAATAELAGLWLAAARDPSGWALRAEPAAHTALSAFSRAGDDGGRARAWAVLAEVAFLQCRIADCEQAVRRASRFARRAGNVREEAQNAGVLALTALVGPLPTEAALRRCRRLLTTYRDNPFVQGRVLTVLGVLLATTGDSAAARAALASSIERLESLGQPVLTALAWEALGHAEDLLGDAPAATRALRRSLHDLDAVGEVQQAGAVAGRLGSLLGPADAGEAAELVTRARVAAPMEDCYAQARWRLSDARAALPGTPGTAARRAEQVLALLGYSDALTLAGEAWLMLAQARRQQGSPPGSRAAARRALALFGEKGHGVGAHAARALIA